MARLLLVGLTLSVLCALGAAINCSPHGIANADHCSSTDRHRSAYTDMDTLMSDAQRQEHMAEFLINVTIGMYQYIHPCASKTEASLVLFYENSQVPASDSTWWQEMGQVVGESPAVGRRKRDGNRFSSEAQLLKNKLDHLVHDTGRDVGCVQYLINRYSRAAAVSFKRLYPNFHAPTIHTTPTTPQSTASSTPTTTVPTTTLPTTTIPITTIPTTTLPTTTLPTTAAPTTIPTLTTHVPTTDSTVLTTLSAGQCTICQGLDCLLNPVVKTCEDSKAFCMITILDRSTGRQIIRGCADQSQCDAIQNTPECKDIETHVLSEGLGCNYCCLGDNCNTPPRLMPVPGTLYQVQP